MKYGIKLFALIGLAVCIGAFSGCSKNPMLSKTYVMAMRGNFFLEDATNFPIRECAEYYASRNGSSGLNLKCQKWSEDYYKRLKASGSIDPVVSLQDFRAKDFWAAVEAAD
jgi:hypothetical protein